MKVGDLVDFKAPDLEDQGLGIITHVAPNPHESVSYKIWVTWHNGMITKQYNWQMKVVA